MSFLEQQKGQYSLEEQSEALPPPEGYLEIESVELLLHRAMHQAGSARSKASLRSLCKALVAEGVIHTKPFLIKPTAGKKVYKGRTAEYLSLDDQKILMRRHLVHMQQSKKRPLSESAVAKIIQQIELLLVKP